MAHSRIHQGSIVLSTGTAVYRMRRSHRAKRLLLKVDPHRGVEVVVPRWATYYDAQRFVNAHQDWLANVLQRVVVVPPVSPALVTGQSLPYLGEHYQLQIVVGISRTRPTVKLEAQTLLVKIPPGYSVRQALTSWYRRQARVYFTQLCTMLASQLPGVFNGITIGSQKTRWGSCSPRGRLSFNWRLLLGPIAVARYVAVHEVAHLRHRNHAPQFWQTVGQLDPAYIEHKTWLKTHGHTLYI